MGRSGREIGPEAEGDKARFLKGLLEPKTDNCGEASRSGEPNFKELACATDAIVEKTKDKHRSHWIGVLKHGRDKELNCVDGS